MSSVTCKKCGFVAAFEGHAPLACPNCGAVYAKVEEALQAGGEVRAAQRAEQSRSAAVPVPMAASSGSRRRGGDAPLDVHAFAKRMRADSLYPTWRQLVVVYKWLGYAAALVLFITGLVMLFSSGAAAGMIPLFTGVVVAIVVKAMVELSLMMADMSDANVRMAAQREA